MVDQEGPETDEEDGKGQGFGGGGNGRPGYEYGLQGLILLEISSGLNA